MNGVHCHTSVATTGGHRVLGDPVRAPAEDAVDQAVRRVVDGVLPQQRGRHRHHQERRDEQRADDAAAEELAVQQDRQPRPSSIETITALAVRTTVLSSAARSRESVSTVGVVVQADELLASPGSQRVPVQCGAVEGDQERNLGHDDGEDEGGQQGRPPDPPFLGAAAQRGRDAGGRCRAAPRPVASGHGSSGQPAGSAAGGAGCPASQGATCISSPLLRRASARRPAPRRPSCCPAIAARDLLRDLGAEVGELGDADELHAQRRPRLHTGVLGSACSIELSVTSANAFADSLYSGIS